MLSLPDAPHINKALTELKGIISETYLSLNPSTNNIDPYTLKEALNKATNRTKEPLGEFWEFLDWFIQTASTRTNAEGITLSYRTVQRYISTKNILKDYEKENSRLTFAGMDFDFFQDLRNFLAAKDYSPNTMAKHTETLKSFIRAADEKGIKVNPAYLAKGTGTKRKQAFDVYLTESDLSKLAAVQLSPKHDKVRDLFLISCYTALRFSDLNSVAKSIEGDYIKLIQFKTKNPVIIPLHKEVKRVLDKYNGNLPDAISNQKFNDYLKEACQEAGITNTVQFKEEKGGKVEIVTRPKYEMVSAHTGRRTFATLQYLAGVPVPTIMQITGHRSVKTFLTYLKLDTMEYAEQMAKKWSEHE